VTRRALAAATRWTGARPDMWAVSLAGLLVRGGILVLAIPILVLPTPIGVASFVGADAVTAAGPTDRFVIVAASLGVTLAAAVVAGFIVGAAVDRVVLRAWRSDRRAGAVLPAGLPPDGAAVTPAPAVPGATRSGAVAGVARVVAVRLVATAPLVAAAAWAIPRIASAGYRELTLPDDLATPFPLRVLVASPDAVAAIIAGLLVCELIAGLATVHVVADDASVARSLWRVAADIVRRPVPVLASFLLGVAALVVLVGAPLAIATFAWGAARDAFAGRDAGAATIAVVVLSAAWVAALLLAGVASAWRRAALASAVSDPGGVRAPAPVGRPEVVAG
jgi:hypothetical protein